MNALSHIIHVRNLMVKQEPLLDKLGDLDPTAATNHIRIQAQIEILTWVLELFGVEV